MDILVNGNEVTVNCKEAGGNMRSASTWDVSSTGKFRIDGQDITIISEKDNSNVN